MKLQDGMKHWLQSRSDPDITTVIREWLVKACSVFVQLLYSLEKPLVWAIIAKSLLSEGVNHASEVAELFTHYIKITTFMLFKNFIIIILR